LGNLARRFVKDGAIYSLQPFIAKAISVLLVPLYTAYLTTGQYGEFSFIFAMGTFLMPLIDMGQVSSFWKFNAEAAPHEAKDVVSTTILIRVLNGAVISLILLALWLFFDIGSPIFVGYILGYTLYSSYKILQCRMRAEHRARTYLVSAVAYSILLVGLNILFITRFSMNSTGVVLSRMISFAFFGILALILAWRSTGLHFNKALSRKMIAYGFPLAMGNIAGVILGVTDKFMIKGLLGDSALGLYSFGFKFGMMFQGFVVTTFFLAWNPVRWEIYKRSDGRALLSRISSVINFAMPGLALIASGVLIVAASILSQGETYLVGLGIVPLVALGYCFYGMYYFDIMGILFAGKTKYITKIVTLGSIVNIVLNYILIRVFGILGAAMATSLSYLMMRSIGYYYSNKLYSIKVSRLSRYIPVIISIAITYYISTTYDPAKVIPSAIILFIGGAIILVIGSLIARSQVKLLLQLLKRKSEQSA